MKLKSTDKVEVVERRLKVNGRPFVLKHPDEPVCCFSEGKLFTLLIKGCGCTLNEWDEEEIEGDYA